MSPATGNLCRLRRRALLVVDAVIGPDGGWIEDGSRCGFIPDDVEWGLVVGSEDGGHVPVLLSAASPCVVWIPSEELELVDAIGVTAARQRVSRVPDRSGAKTS